METNEQMIETQIAFCKERGVDYVASLLFFKIGVSLNVKDGQLPINGLRHIPKGNTTGWYIWSGEVFSEDPDFFAPLHVEHLRDWCPAVIKYLGLPPGYRFLMGENNYEDIWKDAALLKV